MGDSPRDKYMQTREVREEPGNVVEIRIGAGFLKGLAALAAVVVLFVGGVFLGRQFAGGGQSSQTSQDLQNQQIQVQPGQQFQVQPAAPGQQQIQVQPQVPAAPTYQPPAADSVPIGDAPRLAIPEIAGSNYNFDFGDISPNAAVEHTFVIQNKGKQPLVIGDAKSGWGCTASLVSDKQVAPGGQTTLKVAYDPRVENNKGKVTRLITITSNDPAVPVVGITITANVVTN